MKHLIIGTAGHIDHGKTALIKMLTGIDCDTHKEEKQRGITINLGFASMNLPNGESVGIIDVPGHRDFINTMIGGACGIDLVLLVIAADSGIMPQTVEHMNIISALGIKKAVVALTKADLVDDELIELAELEISELLSTSSFRDAPIVRVSAKTERGKNELIKAIADTITGIQEREAGVFFRLFIDRIFTVKGFGSVVTGSVMDGSIWAGQDVYLLPGDKRKLRIRSIERHGQVVEKVVRGDRAALNLIGLRKEDFTRGMIISDKPIETTVMVDACIRLFDTDRVLPLWSSILFIAGTFECQARMHLLDKDLVQGNEEAIVQIHLSRPAVLVSNDKFIIRTSSEDKTLGGGYIIDPLPLHHRKRTPGLLEELIRLSKSISIGSAPMEMIHMVLKKEFRPFTPVEMAETMNVSADEITERSAGPGSGVLVYKSGQITLLVNEYFDTTVSQKILKILAEHHRKNPLFAEGLATNEILGKLMLANTPNGRPYLDSLLNRMQEDGRLDTLNNTWIIKGHKPDFDKKSLAEIDWLEQEILTCADGKPVLSELEDSAVLQNIPKHKIRTYLSYLASNGKIQFHKSDFIHASILNKTRMVLLNRLAEQEDGIDIQEFKELVGGTKRFRALLIDMLDAEKSISLLTRAGSETRLSITRKGKELLRARPS